MICMLITFLVVLAHESDGVRHILLEKALVAEFQNFSEVLVAENESGSLRLKITDESNRDLSPNCDRRLSAEQEEAWLRKDMEVLEKARASAGSASSSSDEHAVEYIKRFLLKNLCTKDEVEKILFEIWEKTSMEKFLEQYIDWAKERNWKILHEYSVDNADVVVVGDLHGHFAAMRAAFRFWLGRVATNPTTRLVFLGDFVDRGRRDVETAIAIMALQMWMNGPVVVLRGNHENDQRSGGSSWTFARSLSRTFSGFKTSGLWDLFVNAFWKLPAAAIMTRGSQRYLMLHGGWTERVLHKIELLKKTDLSTLKRPGFGGWPDANSTEMLIEDLVWSDVMHQNIKGKYGKSERGDEIATYGYEAIDDMFEAFQVDWCISGHKHENLLWMPAKEVSKGHAVVVSANRLRRGQSAKLVVIETKNPPGRVCCCRKDKIKDKSPTETKCEYRFTEKMCCKYKAGSKCTGFFTWFFSKYTMRQDPKVCGVHPSFVELSPLISKYTYIGEITEGHLTV